MPGDLLHAAKRNRLDHLLPQCYLSGFTASSNQGSVCVFDRQEERWFETGAAGVGAIRGFYDYPQGSEPDGTADQAFARLEAGFSTVRRDLVASGFSEWLRQLDFLLRFAQMLRARSQLFREQDLAYSRQLPFLRVEEVEQEAPSNTKAETSRRILRVGFCTPESETEHEKVLRNKSITDMRTEIARGPARLSELHWCLRFTKNATDPVIAADTAVVADGGFPTLEEALQHGETLLFFPICWQACLIGSPAKFDKETDTFHPTDLRRLRALYLKSARRFIFSPTRLAFEG